MKKYTIYLLALLFGSIAHGQVGVGTTAPQGVLHIDAAKNTTIGSPSTNFSDDVVVDNNGNVGIGTIAPVTKLDINSTTPGAIKIVDGTQGAGKVLVSDASGVGTWQTLPVFKYVQNGTYSPSATITSDNTSASFKYSNGSITLSKGNWLVSAALTIQLNSVNAITNANTYWLQLYLSDTIGDITNTKFSYVGNSAKNFGGNMIQSQPSNFNFPGGAAIINVPNDNTTIYLHIQNVYTDPLDSSKTINWTFSTTNYENYFYAVPTN